MSFRKAAQYAAEGCLVKPLLLQFFQDPVINFDFRLQSDWIRTRDPDQWFHASAHPGLSEDELVAYLTGKLKREPLSYNGIMGTLFGTITHAFIQHSLDQIGVLLPVPPGPCVACGRPRSGKLACREHGTRDDLTRSRGHLDGILRLERNDIRGLDIKTIKPFGAYGMKDAIDMDLNYFRQTWPKYYAQVQDYMRMTGLRKFIVFFLSMGNPWEMREYHIPYDPQFAREIELKYLGALQRAGIR